MNDKKATEMTALVYLLADVEYSMLFDLEAYFNKKGLGLKQDSKLRFKMMIDDIKRAKKSALRASEDISLGSMDDYIDSSDSLREIIETAYSKCLYREDRQNKILEFLHNLE